MCSLRYHAILYARTTYLPTLLRSPDYVVCFLCEKTDRTKESDKGGVGELGMCETAVPSVIFSQSVFALGKCKGDIIE